MSKEWKYPAAEQVGAVTTLEGDKITYYQYAILVVFEDANTLNAAIRARKTEFYFLGLDES